MNGTYIEVFFSPAAGEGWPKYYRGDPFWLHLTLPGGVRWSDRMEWNTSVPRQIAVGPYSVFGDGTILPFVANMSTDFANQNQFGSSEVGLADSRTPEQRAVAPRFTRSVFTNGFVTYGDPEFPNGWVRVYAIFENILPANAVFEYYDGFTWRSTTGTIGLKHAILKVPNTNVSNPLLRLRANGVTNNFGYARPTTSQTQSQPAQRPYVRPSTSNQSGSGQNRFQIRKPVATMGVRG